MKHFKYFLLLTTLCFTCSITSCNKDSSKDDPIVEEEEQKEEPKEEPIVDTRELMGTVNFIDKDKTEDHFILINDAASNRVYLMNNDARLVHEWPLNGKRLGNDALLLDNGKLLIMLEAEDPIIQIGGFGGVLALMDKTGEIEWSYELSDENSILHHDAVLLPNGNIIVQLWERKTIEEAKEAGSNLDTDVFPDGIIEINPTTNNVDWEWHAWDHLIQEHDETKMNYAVIKDNPQLINLNHVTIDNGDIMHANGLDYDEINDLIYLSVNFFSEVWVIDHSTTTEEAKTNIGGTQNKGGNLIYRFGNPLAYGNTSGTPLFDNNHFPNLLSNSQNKELLIFSNGGTTEQSTVYELRLPTVLALLPDTDNEPTVNWSFTDTDLFSPKVSGAVRLENGNTMITEGDFGIWEVSSTGDIVWKFEGDGFFWRSYSYLATDPAIIALNLP